MITRGSVLIYKRSLDTATKLTSYYMTCNMDDTILIQNQTWGLLGLLAECSGASVTCSSKHWMHHTLWFQHWQTGFSTHLLLLFFLLGAFLIGTTGGGAARLALGFGVLAIFGALAGLTGGSSSSIFRCFSFSTFFFFFLSFFSFFFLGLTMGPWESAVSCSCTAFSWREEDRQMSKSNTE